MIADILRAAFLGIHTVGEPRTNFECAKRWADKITASQGHSTSMLARAFDAVCYPSLQLNKLFNLLTFNKMTLIEQKMADFDSKVARIAFGSDRADVQVRRFCDDIFEKITADQHDKISDEEFEVFSILVKHNAQRNLSHKNHTELNSLPINPSTLQL